MRRVNGKSCRPHDLFCCSGEGEGRRAIGRGTQVLDRQGEGLKCSTDRVRVNGLKPTNTYDGGWVLLWLLWDEVNESWLTEPGTNE